MPWTVDDVEQHKKGLTPKQKRAWVAVANDALERCQESGGDDCDAKAIRQANSAAMQADMMSESFLWLAERQPTNLLVALWLDPETAAQLAVSGGEPADNLHITLCMCGDAAEMGDLAVYRTVAAIERAVQWWGTVEGTVSGYGRFNPTDSSDEQSVFYASVDILGLTELRQRVMDALYEVGTPPVVGHGFTPHLTLAYLPADAANPVEDVPSTKLRFDGVTVMVGGKRIDVPFARPVVSLADAPAELPPTAPLDMLLARPMLFEATQEWIAFLPKPGKYHHSIFDLDLTAEKYDRIVGNFKRNTYGQDLPINVEHDFRAAGAVGWIRDMRIAGDGSIEVKPDWNERGKALLEGDRFRYVSAEWGDRWQDPVSGEFHADVPMGLAICTHPHLKPNVLKPLAMSEEAALVTFSSSAGATGTEATMPEDQNAQPVVATETPTSTTTAPPVVVATETPPARTINDFSLTEVVISAEQRQRERQHVTTLTQRVELAEQRATQAEAEAVKLKREMLEERAKAEVLGRSADNGTAWFGSIQENTTWLLNEAVEHGWESDEVKRLVRHKRQEANAIHASGIFDPITKGGQEPAGDVMGQVRHLAELKMQADPKLTYELAETQVYNEKPELYTRVLNAR